MTTPIPLTEAQQEVLDFVEAYTSAHRRPPTIREMQKAGGYASPRAITYTLEKLILAGRIVAKGGSRGYFPTSQAAAPAPFSFIIPINPESMQSETRQGRNHRTGRSQFYSTDRKKQYQSDIGFLAAQHRPREPLNGALIVDYLFIHPRTEEQLGRTFPDGLIPKITIPDRDNLQKPVQDALSQARFWTNDSRIFDGRTAKFHAERTGQPRIEITITEII